MSKQTRDGEVVRESQSNERRYYQCSQPHADLTAAKAALNRFIEKVEQAREECNIANVAFVVKDSAWQGDEIGSFLMPGFMGDVMQEEAMLAYAFARAQDTRKQRIAAALGEFLKG